MSGFEGPTYASPPRPSRAGRDGQGGQPGQESGPRREEAGGQGLAGQCLQPVRVRHDLPTPRAPRPQRPVVCS